jgi:hypothetical protein
MSSSSANPSPDPAGPDESPGQEARPSGRSKDEITVVQVPGLPPVPAFLSAAARPPANDGSDGSAQSAETPTLESEVKRLQAALNTAAARNPPVQPSGRGKRLPPGPARAVPGSAGPGMLTAMLARPGFAVAGMTLASVMIAVVAGTFVFVILPQTEDWDLAELPPPVASREPSLPEAPALPSESRAGVTGGEVGREAQPGSQQPAVPSQAAAQPENRPAEKPMEVAALDLPPDLPPRPEAPVTMAPEPAPPASPVPPAAAVPEAERPERAVIVAQALTLELAAPAPREAAPPVLEPPRLAPPVLEPPVLAPPMPAPPARSEPPAVAAPAPSPFASQESLAMAAPAPVPSARPEPPPELLTVNPTPRHAGRTAAPYRDRAGFQFADSGIRYLTGAELERLSVDRLRIARNEIFARKGRHFKDDALRAYFSQFAWYQPRAWDVPLNPIEVANVRLIQSIEDAAAPQTRGIGEPVAAEPDAGTRVTDPRRQVLSPADLQGLSTDQLALVRNEIFARKGRYFKDPALRAYFEQFPWYQPYAWDVPLNPVERANIDLIQSIEQSRGGRVPPT